MFLLVCVRASNKYLLHEAAYFAKRSTAKFFTKEGARRLKEKSDDLAAKVEVVKALGISIVLAWYNTLLSKTRTGVAITIGIT